MRPLPTLLSPRLDWRLDCPPANTNQLPALSPYLHTYSPSKPTYATPHYHHIPSSTNQLLHHRPHERPPGPSRFLPTTPHLLPNSPQTSILQKDRLLYRPPQWMIGSAAGAIESLSSSSSNLKPRSARIAPPLRQNAANSVTGSEWQKGQYKSGSKTGQ